MKVVLIAYEMLFLVPSVSCQSCEPLNERAERNLQFLAIRMYETTTTVLQ